MKKDSKEYGGWQIYDYKQSYKISEFLLQAQTKWKDSLCYSESIDVHFRSNKPLLQE